MVAAKYLRKATQEVLKTFLLSC